MNLCFAILALLTLGACVGSPKPLTVKQFTLKSTVPDSIQEPMVKMESSRRLFGAVSTAERNGRLGQYYTMLWNDPAGAGDVEVRLEYRQGATASRVKQMVRSFPAADTQGKAEFVVIGDDFLKGGRVLAWKATLRRGGNIVETQQSYLWD